MKSMIKRVVVCMLICLIFGQIAVLFADESDLFFKSVPITGIYPHKLGYRIIYMRTNMDLDEFYVPLKWFQYDQESGGVGKGELVVGTDASYPYFSIFWKNGEFHHIRLYLHKDRRHESWGSLPPNVDIDSRFDVETLNLRF